MEDEWQRAKHACLTMTNTRGVISASCTMLHKHQAVSASAPALWLHASASHPHSDCVSLTHLIHRCHQELEQQECHQCRAVLCEAKALIQARRVAHSSKQQEVRQQNELPHGEVDWGVTQLPMPKFCFFASSSSIRSSSADAHG